MKSVKRVKTHIVWFIFYLFDRCDDCWTECIVIIIISVGLMQLRNAHSIEHIYRIEAKISPVQISNRQRWRHHHHHHHHRHRRSIFGTLIRAICNAIRIFFFPIISTWHNKFFTAFMISLEMKTDTKKRIMQFMRYVCILFTLKTRSLSSSSSSQMQLFVEIC